MLTKVATFTSLLQMAPSFLLVKIATAHIMEEHVIEHTDFGGCILLSGTVLNKGSFFSDDRCTVGDAVFFNYSKEFSVFRLPYDKKNAAFSFTFVPYDCVVGFIKTEELAKHHDLTDRPWENN